MALMFGRNARSQQKNVVEFRAGKMTLKGIKENALEIADKKKKVGESYIELKV